MRSAGKVPGGDRQDKPTHEVTRLVTIPATTSGESPRGPDMLHPSLNS